MIAWLFDSKQRLQWVAVGLAVLSLVLFIALTTARLARLDLSVPAPTASEASAPTPDSTATGLLPPSPAADEPSPFQDYGSAAPIALEAVQCFLLGDRAGFAALAQQDAVEAVNEAPVPGGQITGQADVVLPGPTRQQVSVPTTDGDLLMDMIVVDSAWKVQSMEYRR